MAEKKVTVPIEVEPEAREATTTEGTKKAKEPRPPKDAVLEYYGPAATIRGVGALEPGAFVTKDALAALATSLGVSPDKAAADLCTRKSFRRVERR
jgi:hypothetical protein